MNEQILEERRPQHGVDWAHLDAWVRTFGQEEGLSPQETTVLKLTTRGLSDKQVADEIGVSRSTVATYWRRIYDKLGVHGHREVLARFLRFVTDPREIDLERNPPSGVRARAVGVRAHCDVVQVESTHSLEF